ncbi:MAG: serine/threonine-protein kinase [Bryobacteraceae bacterium]|jgi:serine/threonine-protein kinase
MIGTEIGNYRIVDKLGAGGMGVVYKAIDTHLDRVVAIKALNPEFSQNPELLERFRGEARAQAQLNHPNLATLYAFLVQDGAAYMVMEFVDGETFHAMLKARGPIPAAEAVPLFRQALAGIGHAHRLGIVHRDIKPTNIMLNRDGIVKVMDFGLAKVAGGHGMTRSGVRLGTAYYMSPEQVLVKPVDARSDIYSLGVTLYEMLTGQVPFQADSEFEILNDHVNTPPPPPSRQHRIPQGVEDAVMKALAKNPDQRFQTAEQFSAALEHPEEFYLANTVGDAAPVTAARRISVAAVPTAVPAPAKPALWTRPRKLLAGGAALACLLAAWLALRPQPQPQIPQPTPQLQASHPAATSTTAAEPAAAPPPEKPAPQASRTVVPSATGISVRTVDPIDSKSSRVGQEFLAKLAAAVKVRDHEAFHEGDEAHLRLGQTASDGHSGKPELILELVSIATGGQNYAVTSAPFLIKGGFLRKKKVAPGTQIDFALSAPVTVGAPPI